MTVNQSVKRDAEEFGRVEKKTNEQQWMQALRVARSCENQQGHSHLSQVGKVSLLEFSRQAGVSKTTIYRYFDAWERASQIWVLPPSAQLRPGQAVDFPIDDETGGLYPFAKIHTQHPEATGSGTGGQPTSSQVTKAIAADPSRLTYDAAAAIAADPVAARLVAEALADKGLAKTREQTQRRLVREHEMDDATAEEIVASVYNFSTAYLFGEQGKKWADALDLAVRRDVEVTPKQIEGSKRDVRRIINALQVLEVRAGGDIDAEWAEMGAAL